MQGLKIVGFKNSKVFSKEKFSSFRKIPLLILLFLIFSISSIFAQTTYYSQGNNTWSTSANWNTNPGGGGSTGVPANGDTAIIQNTHTVTVNQNVQIDSLNIETGGTLEFNGNGGTAVTFTCDANIVVDGDIITTYDGNVVLHSFNVAGDLTGSGNLDGYDLYNVSNYTLININFNGSTGQLFSLSGSTIEFYNFTISSSGQVTTTNSNFTVFNNFTMANGSDVVLGSGEVTLEGGNMYIGTSSPSSVTLDATSNSPTLIFTVSGTKYIYIYENRTLSNITINKTSGSLSINGTGAGQTLTINGTLTRTLGTVVLSTSTLAFGSSSTVLYNGSSQTAGVEWTGSLAPANVQVNNTALALGTSNKFSLTGNLTLTKGAVTYSGSNNILSVGGNVAGGSGSFGASDDTLIVTGANSTITSSGATTISNLRVTGSSASLSQITISGNTIINSSGTVTVTNSISVSTLNVVAGTIDINGQTITKTGTSQLILASGATLRTGGSTTAIIGYNSRSLDANSTINFDYAGAESIPAGISYGDITVSGSGTKTFASGTISMQSNATLRVQNGILDLNGQTLSKGTGCILQVDALATLETGSATASTAITGFGTYTLNGTLLFNGGVGNETLPSGVSGQSFSLTLQKSAGNLLTQSAITFGGLNDTLNLQQGIVDVSSGNITLAAGMGIKLGNPTSYVNGTILRIFNSAVESGTVPKVLPIGSGIEYRPVTIDFQGLNGIVTVTATLNEGTTPTGSLPTGITAFATGFNRYWSIDTTGTGAFTGYDVGLIYTGTSDTPANLRIIRGTNATSYTDIGANQLVSGVDIEARFTGIELTADFAIGRTGATKYWDLAGTGNWSVATNWSDDIQPQNGDVIVLDHSAQAAAYTVVFNSAATATSLDNIQIAPGGGNSITLRLDKTSATLDLTNTSTAITLENHASANLIFNGTTITMGGGGAYNSALTTIGAASLVEYRNGSAGNTLHPDEYGDLTISNTSGTVSASGTVTAVDFVKSGAGDLTTSGNLTVSSSLTKNDAGAMTVSTATCSTAVLDVNAGGTLTITGSSANLIVTGSGAAANDGTINLSGTGNSSFTGTFTNNATGVLNINNGAGTTGFTGAVTNSGDMNFIAGAGAVTFTAAYSGSGTLDAAGATPAITFNGTFSPSGSVTFGSQTVNLGNDISDNANISAGTFTPSSTTNFVGGDFQISGSGQISSSSGRVIFTGASAQTITDNSSASMTFNNITINNVNNVTLNAAVSVAGNFTLTQGDLITTTTELITFGTAATVSDGSDDSHINGPAAKSTNSISQFVFPIGNGSIWRQIAVSPQTSTATTFQAQFYNSNPRVAYGSTPGAGVDHVSSVRYWTVSRTSGTANAQIRLYWEDGSDGVQDPSDLLVTRWTGTEWASRGNGGTTGDSNSGSVISSSAFTSFGPFTLGSAAGDNSLPVELVSFEATPSYSDVFFTWKVASEINNAGFNIYQQDTKEGSDWEVVNRVIIAGQGNSSEEKVYNFKDTNVKCGHTYKYKLESVSINGVRVEERVIEISVPVPKDFALLNNYPNPFNPVTNIKFLLPEKTEVTILIYDILGHFIKEIISKESLDPGPHIVQWNATDNFDRKVASGLYVYVLSAGKFNKSGKMLLLK